MFHPIIQLQDLAKPAGTTPAKKLPDVFSVDATALATEDGSASLGSFAFYANHFGGSLTVNGRSFPADIINSFDEKDILSFSWPPCGDHSAVFKEFSMTKKIKPLEEGALNSFVKLFLDNLRILEKIPAGNCLLKPGEQYILYMLMTAALDHEFLEEFLIKCITQDSKIVSPCIWNNMSILFSNSSGPESAKNSFLLIIVKRFDTVSVKEFLKHPNVLAHIGRSNPEFITRLKSEDRKNNKIMSKKYFSCARQVGAKDLNVWVKKGNESVPLARSLYFSFADGTLGENKPVLIKDEKLETNSKAPGAIPAAKDFTLKR